MPIKVQHQPSAAAIGGAAVRAGYGQYEQGQQRLAQQRFLQEQQIGARLEQQQRGIDADLYAQDQQNRQRQEMAMLQYVAGQQSDAARAQAAQAQAMQGRQWDVQDAQQQQDFAQERYEWTQSGEAKQLSEGLQRKKSALDTALQNGTITPRQHELGMLRYQTEFNDIEMMPPERSEFPIGQGENDNWHTESGAHVQRVRTANGYEIKPMPGLEKDVVDPAAQLKGPDRADKRLEITGLERDEARKDYKMKHDAYLKELSAKMNNENVKSADWPKWDHDTQWAASQQSGADAYRRGRQEHGLGGEGEPPPGPALEAAAGDLPEGAEVSYEAVEEELRGLVQVAQEQGGYLFGEDEARMLRLRTAYEEGGGT